MGTSLHDAGRVPDASPSRNRILPAVLCVVLAVVAGLASFLATRTKSSTPDEPVQAMAAWTAAWHSDLRVTPHQPPLWQTWMALASGPDTLGADFAHPSFRRLPEHALHAVKWSLDTLYRTPGNDGEGLVQRFRAMMILFPVALGLALARWGWRLGGPVAAVAATAMFALDPSFLGHGTLLKSDVPMALAWVATTWAAWSAGRRVTVANASALGLALGLALGIKLTGLLLVPLLAIVLGVRAAMPAPWDVLGRTLATRGRRAVAAAALWVTACGVAYGLLWASYGFRYDATPEPGLRIRTENYVHLLVKRTEWAKHPDREPTESEVAALPVPLVARAAVWAEDRRLLPQAYTAGLVYQFADTRMYPSYLLGERSSVGWWTYFPCVVLFKTPMATLAAFGLAALAGILAWRRRRNIDAWAATCLALPVALYGAASLQSSMNLGIRHLLPVYPFLFLGTGVALAAVWNSKSARRAATVLAALLAAETAAAWPDLIAFFNAPSRARGTLGLLGDSNLDWGQDLPALAAWQQRNPERRLYLSYFGAADPGAYGIVYTSVPGGSEFGNPPFESPRGPAVLAVSATNLQGIYMADAGLRARYRKLWDETPIAVLGGGTIYLYEVR